MTEQSSRIRRGPAAVCAAVLIVAGTIYVIANRPGRGPDDGTVTPEAVVDEAWVGWQRCAECHEDQAATYEVSGHSHTFAFTRDSSVAQKLCGRSLFESEAYGRFDYACDDEGLTVALTERFGGNLFPLDFAMGSGKHAVTFFSLMPDGDETVGVEHRLTWFAADESLDITPGHADLLPGAGHGAEFFGRVMRDRELQRCLECHTTRYDIADHRLAAVMPNVQCEACHGPGGEHVAAAEAEDGDVLLQSISRPTTAAEEIALCGRCHRLADEIPAERLQRYPNSLVRFQPVGLTQSRCYTETPGGLACTTCHNPHEPAGMVSYAEHERTCVGCHDTGGQSVCPVSPRSDCVSCHMPAIELLRGIAFHDHWIRVRADDGQQTTPQPGSHSTISPER